MTKIQQKVKLLLLTLMLFLYETNIILPNLIEFISFIFNKQSNAKRHYIPSQAENQVNEAVCTPWPGSNQLQAESVASRRTKAF